MIVRYLTLDNKPYAINTDNYPISWNKKRASLFQFNIKKFFHKYWAKDICCEEFPCRPKVSDQLRFDIVNVTRKIVVEAHHDQHVEYSEFFHQTQKNFIDKQLKSDRLKEMWCEHNGYKLIEIFNSDLPLQLHVLLTKYGNICY